MKNSYTQHIRKQMQTTRERVMQLLQWNEAQYADYQYRMGCQYLQSYISRDPEGIDMLVDSNIFWNWWRNHWLLRDAKFINGNDTSKAAYFSLHSPDNLIGNIYPNSAVLHDGYARMINEFQNNVK